MPIYEFETSTGEVLEQFFPMADAPRVGTEVVIEGVPCVRIFERQHVQCAERHTPFESHSICPKAAKRLGHKEFGATGSPIFRSHKQAHEFAAKSEGLYEYAGMPTQSERDRHVVPMNEIAKKHRARY